MKTTTGERAMAQQLNETIRRFKRSEPGSIEGIADVKLPKNSDAAEVSERLPMNLEDLALYCLAAERDTAAIWKKRGKTSYPTSEDVLMLLFKGDLLMFKEELVVAATEIDEVSKEPIEGADILFAHPIVYVEEVDRTVSVITCDKIREYFAYTSNTSPDMYLFKLGIMRKTNNERRTNDEQTPGVERRTIQ